MTKTEEKLKQFFDLYEELRIMDKENAKDQSEMDLKLSDMYHKIERTKFTHVSQSHNMMKELQEVLLKRRIVKGDRHHFHSVNNSIFPHLGKATIAFHTHIKKTKEKYG